MTYGYSYYGSGSGSSWGYSGNSKGYSGGGHGGYDSCGSKGGYGGSWGGSKGGSSWGGQDDCGWGGSKGGSSWGGKDDHGWGGSKGGSSWGGQDDCGWGGSKGGSSWGGNDHGWGGSKGGSSWGGQNDCGWGGSKGHGWGGSSWGDKGDCGWGGKGDHGWGGSSWGGKFDCGWGDKGDHGWGGSSWGGKGDCGWGGKGDHGWGGWGGHDWGGGKGDCGPDPEPEFTLGDEGRTCHFTLESCGLELVVTVTEYGNALKFDIQIADDSAKVGDLRGLFFNLDVADGADLFVLSGDDVTDSEFGHRDVDDLGNGANVRGWGPGYDVGVEFGTAGIGKDDIQHTSFILANADGALTLDELDDNAVAARLTSVGDEGGCRNDSLKIVGETGALDCGSFENNEPPTPADDAAGVCAGETTTIDVLANDTDPDQTDPGPDGHFGLNVTDVWANNQFQTLTDGGPAVTLDSGATVTLVDGELVYDSAGVWDDLLIGEQATDTFQYAVADADGDPGFADVTVTICGSLNLVETLSNDDPTLATFDLDSVLSDGDTGSVVSFSSAIDFLDPAFDGLDGTYGTIFCVDRDRALNQSPTQALVYSSLGDLPTTSPDGGDFIDHPENLDQVNWILNQGFEDEFDFDDIQSAIWALVDDAGGVDTQPFPWVPGVQLSAGAMEILAQAAIDGEGFTPTGENGDVAGMIFQPVTGNETDGFESNGQIMLVAFQLEDCLCA